MRRDEDDLLNIFVDLCSLFRRKPLAVHQAGGEAPSTEAYLFSYLRALDSEGENLPPDFLQALRKAVAHYGITNLKRAPELEECLLWIYKSHQKMERQIAPILAVLQRRLAQLNGKLTWADEAFHTLLDRMVSITRELFPSLTIWRASFAIVVSNSRSLRTHADGYTPRWRSTWIISRPIRTRRIAAKSPRSGRVSSAASQLAGWTISWGITCLASDHDGDRYVALLHASANQLPYAVRRWPALRQGSIRRRRKTPPRLHGACRVLSTR